MKIIRLIEKIRNYIRLIYYKTIFGNKLKVGKKVSARKSFNIRIGERGKLEIGDNCFFNNNLSISVMDNIKIGDNSIFGENVKIYDHNHIFNIEETLIKDSGYKVKEVSIGTNCWIGSNVVILKGVSIGNNVVVGANCLIKEDIPDNIIVQLKNNIDLVNIQYKKR